MQALILNAPRAPTGSLLEMVVGILSQIVRTALHFELFRLVVASKLNTGA